MIKFSCKYFLVMVIVLCFVLSGCAAKPKVSVIESDEFSFVKRLDVNVKNPFSVEHRTLWYINATPDDIIKKINANIDTEKYSLFTFTKENEHWTLYQTDNAIELFFDGDQQVWKITMDLSSDNKDDATSKGYYLNVIFDTLCPGYSENIADLLGIYDQTESQIVYRDVICGNMLFSYSAQSLFLEISAAEQEQTQDTIYTPIRPN